MNEDLSAMPRLRNSRPLSRQAHQTLADFAAMKFIREYWKEAVVVVICVAYVYASWAMLNYPDELWIERGRNLPVIVPESRLLPP